jgi:hypothetical protein
MPRAHLGGAQGVAEAIGTSKSDVRFRMPTGAYWSCPSGVPHSVRAVTDCTLLHIFTGASRRGMRR